MKNRDNLGRGLLTLAVITTPAFHLSADWSVGHFADPAWPVHAKYHLIVYHLTLCLIGLIAVHGCWGRWRANPLTAPLVMAIVIAFWLPIYLAAVFPQASPYATQELADRGFPVQFVVGAVLSIVAFVGWAITGRVIGILNRSR